MRRRLCALALGAVTLAATPALAQSLWREGHAAGNIFADHRARAVNDIVTIVVVEQSTQSRSANTTTSKSTSRTAALNDFPGLALPTRNAKAAENLKLALAGKAEHEGKGSIDRSDRALLNRLRERLGLTSEQAGRIEVEFEAAGRS